MDVHSGVHSGVSIEKGLCRKHMQMQMQMQAIGGDSVERDAHQVGHAEAAQVERATHLEHVRHKPVHNGATRVVQRLYYASILVQLHDVVTDAGPIVEQLDRVTGQHLDRTR